MQRSAKIQLIISLAKQLKPFVEEKGQIGWRMYFPVSFNADLDIDDFAKCFIRPYQ